MSKRGRLNVYLYKIPHKSIRYVRDLWNTLVNMRWRWLMLTVSLINVIAYFLFAELFLLDAWISGDFTSAYNNNKCINGVHNFTSFFMLGIETITTTGYGYFHPTENCVLVWFILTFSTLVTIFIDGAFISVVYVKISRPAYTINYSLFSKKAVVCITIIITYLQYLLFLLSVFLDLFTQWNSLLNISYKRQHRQALDRNPNQIIYDNTKNIQRRRTSSKLHNRT